MVSIVLLTTEEVLQRNGYWFCLDTVWVTEEMEPFEEVKHEHMFTKPLSRDFYYARYPDIPRSESDDENSLSLNGFKSKHQQWKSKICVKKFDAQRRNSCQSYLSCSGSKNETRRVASLLENGINNKLIFVNENTQPRNNDEKVLDFLRRLHESVPPPPVEDLQYSQDKYCNSIVYSTQNVDFDEVDLPDYNDFVDNKLKQAEFEEHLLPTTSTLKKSDRKVSFNLNKSNNDFISDESWYDSIYGVSDLLLWTSDSAKVQTIDSSNTNISYNDPDLVDYFPSWSDILKECDVNEDSILHAKDSLTLPEALISCSNIDTEIANPDLAESDSEEAGYARFAIYKIHQTLKIHNNDMLDSSSMIDLSETEHNLFNKTSRGSSFFGTVYRLAPNYIDDFRESGNS